MSDDRNGSEGETRREERPLMPSIAASGSHAADRTLVGEQDVDTEHANPGLDPPIEVEQIRMLLEYAGERGINPSPDVLGTLYKALSDHEMATTDAERRETGAVLVTSYAKLAKVTYDADCINGRTLAGTARSKKEINLILSIGAFLFVVVSTIEVGDLYIADYLPPESGVPWWFNFHQYVLTYLSPFFWGAFGAIVFIAKRLADETAELRFDYQRFKGVVVKVGLGAVLAAVVVSFYDATAFTESGVNLDQNAIAFLVGLGYKVVYGALEKSVEVLAEKLNLETIRRARVRPPRRSEAPDQAGGN